MQTDATSTNANSQAATGRGALLPCPDCNFDFGASQNKIRRAPEALYAHYSKQNGYPSAQEETLIKTGIIEALAQISVINSRIDRLNAMVGLLVEERARIEDIAGEYRTMLRPINRLPSELLTRIFLFSTDIATVDISNGFRGPQPPTSLDPLKHPWVLSQVCQSWRRLALDTPSLWSLISFTFPSNNKGSHSKAVLRAKLHRLQLQLQRTAKHPIDIVTQTPDPKSTAIERFLSPLCYHSPNWRHLRIELHGDLFRPWTSSITGRLQSLESLHVKFIGPISDDSGDFECLQYAPQLKSLVFSADHRISDAVWYPRKLRLPYEQITRYSWQDLDLDGMLQSVLERYVTISHNALYLLTELEFCRLSLHSKSVIRYQSLPSPQDPLHSRLLVSFGRLVELELLNVDAAARKGIHVVLLFIRAPSLKKLTISSSGQDPTTFSTFFMYRQQLVSLSIHRVEMPPDDFAAVLTLLPSLRELSFGVPQVYGISNEYLSLLGQTDPSSGWFSVVPILQTLSLLPAGHFSSTYTTEVLVKVLEDRWRHTVPEPRESAAAIYSQLVSVHLDKDVDDERLDRLRSEGLRIEVWEGGWDGSM
ncbi:hypothetical protein AAF712_010748 [Marasmius tenuissimus]|uniref:F-box domain-containing protein n=1 Tax=Marasmius tenuissimus TaxID=585030 RepID=A0ABR2ZL57_9AGAR